MRRGSNLPAVGGYNQTLVIDLIRRSGDGVSRVELAERSGLSAQTLSNVTRRLIDEGLVREAGKVGSGPGKPRTLLQLNAGARYAVGVHLDPAVITYVVLDLDGHVVARARGRTPRGIPPTETLQRLAASIRDIVSASGVDPARIIGVGIASPGPLDAEHGRVFDPPLLEEWHDVPLGDSLAASTGYPVLLEKDVTAAMIGENWIDVDDRLRNSMFCYYGTGVGAGLTLEGDIVRGATSNLGNIGHLIVDPGGPLCRCGKRGCLGDAITPGALIAEGIARGVLTVTDSEPDPDPTDGAGPTDATDGAADAVYGALDRLAAAAAAGDPAACDIIDATARRLARAVLAVVDLLDLDNVVFGGPVWERLGSVLIDRIATAVRADPASQTVHTVGFTGSRLGGDVAAIGAGCLVLDGAFTARPTSLLIDS